MEAMRQASVLQHWAPMLMQVEKDLSLLAVPLKPLVNMARQ